MKLSNSISSSPTLSQGFPIFSSKPMAKRLLWTSSKLCCWTVSPATMDLFCSKTLVDKTCKSKDTMQLKSNGRSVLVSQKAAIAGCKREVWFSTSATANVIALSNLIQRCRVTHNSKDLMFVVHHDPEKPNTESCMHESGLAQRRTNNWRS